MTIPRRAARYITILALTSLAYPLTAWSQATIPFALRDNLIRVPVVLDGHAASGVLDSGTGGLAVSTAFARRYRLPRGRLLTMVSGGGSKRLKIYAAHAREVRVGPLSFHNIDGFFLDTRELTASAGFPVDVLLGLPILEKQPVSINYPARSVTFWTDAQAPQCNNPVPFDMSGGTPRVAAEVRVTAESRPVTIHLLVDLGTRHHAIIVGGPFLSKPDGKALVANGPVTMVGHGIGGKMLGRETRFASMRLGSRTYQNVETATSKALGPAKQGLADGTLGVPFYGDGTITFDYANHAVCLPG